MTHSKYCDYKCFCSFTSNSQILNECSENFDFGTQQITHKILSMFQGWTQATFGPITTSFFTIPTRPIVLCWKKEERIYSWK